MLLRKYFNLLDCHLDSQVYKSNLKKQKAFFVNIICLMKNSKILYLKDNDFYNLRSKKQNLTDTT